MANPFVMAVINALKREPAKKTKTPAPAKERPRPASETKADKSRRGGGQ